MVLVYGVVQAASKWSSFGALGPIVAGIVCSRCSW